MKTSSSKLPAPTTRGAAATKGALQKESAALPPRQLPLCMKRVSVVGGSGHGREREGACTSGWCAERESYDAVGTRGWIPLPQAGAAAA